MSNGLTCTFIFMANKSVVTFIYVNKMSVCPVYFLKYQLILREILRGVVAAILTSEIICSGGLPERHLCVENEK